MLEFTYGQVQCDAARWRLGLRNH